MIDYLVAISIIVGIYAIFAIGLNLEWGFTGLINFGHVGFLAIGAYTTVLMNLSGAPIWLSMASGVVLAGFFGLLVGIPTLRLREDYLAIVTIGFSEIVRLFLLNEEWLTRGPMGLFGFDRPFEAMIPFSTILASSSATIFGRKNMLCICSPLCIFGPRSKFSITVILDSTLVNWKVLTIPISAFLKVGSCSTLSPLKNILPLSSL